jgi:hypothetical protein
VQEHRRLRLPARLCREPLHSEVQCRVDGDTCDFSNDCCSGLCRIDSNTCAPDRAPIADAGSNVTVPRHVLHTLPNASSDPDGTTLEYT